MKKYQKSLTAGSKFPCIFVLAKLRGCLRDIWDCVGWQGPVITVSEGPRALWPAAKRVNHQAAAASVKRSDRATDPVKFRNLEIVSAPVQGQPWVMLELLGGSHVDGRSSELPRHRLGPLILSSNHPHTLEATRELGSHKSAMIFSTSSWAFFNYF